MDRDIQGQRTATYLWEVKQIVPFVKVDKGLTAEADGVQVMKPMRNSTRYSKQAGRERCLRHEDAVSDQTRQFSRH